MTNKLPEVGKRYKFKLQQQLGEAYTSRSFLIEATLLGFEEIPDQETTKENHIADVGKMVLSDEVKEAMEELRNKEVISKDIWKPVSELLYDSALSPEQIQIFEVITDYINNIEERLTKLEGKE